MSLTADGFQRDTLPGIKAELDSDLTDALGPVNTNADSVLGQISGIVAEAVANIQEVLQDTYDSMYPSTAEGTSLDGAVEYVGIERIDASPTIVTCAAYGNEGQSYDQGQTAIVSGTDFTSTSIVTVSRANALDVEIEVATVTNSAGYQILAGGLSFTYNSDIDATEAEILAGLLALVQANDFFTASVTGTTLRMYAADGVSPFAVTVDSKLTIKRRGSPMVFVAAENGAIAVPVGAMTTTNIGIEIYNLAAGATGRDVETDAELRARHAAFVRGTGSATVEAIKARMLADVDGVTSIAIYENRTAIEVDGLPPHSYESVIQGGTNSAIASQLWLTKPAGIETYGNVTVLTPDTAGDNQEVSFSRAVVTYGWLTIAVTALNTEESLPATASDAIKAAALAYANANIGVGDDIILQRFIGPIYLDVPGLASITITADVTAAPTDTPTYGSANIAVARAEIVEFSLDRMTVTGV